MLVTPVRVVAGRFQGPGKEVGGTAMNYADLAWGKGRPLGTRSITCRRIWGAQLAAAVTAHS